MPRLIKLPKEEWRNIPGIPEYYEVSNLGRLRSLARIDRRGWHIKTRIMNFRNAEVTLVDKVGKLKWYPVAALILRAFIGPAPQGMRLSRHLDDNRNNNLLSNLAWGTDQDNHNDAKCNGISFVSYGHLGKPHSEATKLKLSIMKKGVKHGRPLSDAHKAAMLVGYRKKFPAKNI